MDENELLEVNADLMEVIREKQEIGALDEAIVLQILLHKNLMRLRHFLAAPEQKLPDAPEDWQPPIARSETPEPGEDATSKPAPEAASQNEQASTLTPPRSETSRKRPVSLTGTFNTYTDSLSCSTRGGTNKGKRKVNREPRRSTEAGRVSSPAVAKPPAVLAPALPGTSPYLNNVGAHAPHWKGGLSFSPQKPPAQAPARLAPGVPGVQNNTAASGLNSSGRLPFATGGAMNPLSQGLKPNFPPGGGSFWPSRWPQSLAPFHPPFPAQPPPPPPPPPPGAAASATAATGAASDDEGSEIDVGETDHALSYPSPLKGQEFSEATQLQNDGLNMEADDNYRNAMPDGNGALHLEILADRAILAQPWTTFGQRSQGAHDSSTWSSTSGAQPLEQHSGVSNLGFDDLEPA